jgi:hypothetical protein
MVVAVAASAQQIVARQNSQSAAAQSLLRRSAVLFHMVNTFFADGVRVHDRAYPARAGGVSVSGEWQGIYSVARIIA